MSYFKRLKDHPGIEFAFALTFAFTLAGISNRNIEVWWHGALFGFLVSLLPWSIVLISNIKRK